MRLEKIQKRYSQIHSCILPEFRHLNSTPVLVYRSVYWTKRWIPFVGAIAEGGFVISIFVTWIDVSVAAVGGILVPVAIGTLVPLLLKWRRRRRQNATAVSDLN